MGFVKKLAIEAFEITEVMRVEFLSATAFNQSRNGAALFAHGRKIMRRSSKQKEKTFAALPLNRSGVSAERQLSSAGC